MKNGDFPVRYVCLPESSWMLVRTKQQKTMEFSHGVFPVDIYRWTFPSVLQLNWRASWPERAFRAMSSSSAFDPGATKRGDPLEDGEPVSRDSFGFVDRFGGCRRL